MLLEQINLSVEVPSIKKQSEFSKQYQLVTVYTGKSNEMALKSSYSECVTRTSKLEYNVCGVATKCVLVFAKCSSAGDGGDS